MKCSHKLGDSRNGLELRVDRPLIEISYQEGIEISGQDNRIEKICVVVRDRNKRKSSKER